MTGLVEWGTRGHITHDTVRRDLPDAQAVLTEWPGCYGLLRRVNGGAWEPAKPRLVSLCTGYSGLEMGLRLAGADFELTAVADVNPHATALLALRHPGVPNLGDLREIDWTRLEAEILTAGFPCQPVSAAGRRAGTDDERWLFDAIAEGIGAMGTRPRLLVFENVLGLLTANGGDAMGRVVRGLAALGYVGRYRVHRACDVGAPHGRARVFIVASLPGASPAEGFGSPVAGSGGCPVLSAGRLLPTPRTTDGTGTGVHGDGGLDLSTAVALLPTPQASIAAYSSDGYGATLAEVTRLLPTPRATDGTHGGPNQRGSRGDLMLPSAVQLLPTPAAARSGRQQSPSPGASIRPSLDMVNAIQWGGYAPAIARWETVIGRTAPCPTDPKLSKHGNRRLSPRFVEWMMGLPDGHVTDAVGHNAALGLLGNGVVPQQAAAALRELVGYP